MRLPAGFVRVLDETIRVAPLAMAWGDRQGRATYADAKNDSYADLTDLPPVVRKRPA